MAKALVSTTKHPPTSSSSPPPAAATAITTTTDRPGYLIDSSKSVIGRPVESFSNIVGIDRTIKEACNIGGVITPSFQRLLLELPTDDDRLAVANFIIESYHDRNISVKTKCAYITSLVYLSRFCQNKKSFKDMTATDIVVGYLNSLKRPFEADPDQRWIATYNLRASVFLKFFKWLTQPDLEVSSRQLDACSMLKGLRFVKKGPKTHIKPTDLWTLEDDAIFVKYCEDARITCYHMMSRIQVPGLESYWQ